MVAGAKSTPHAASAPSMEELVEQLKGMGFDEAAAVQALHENALDAGAAVAYLIAHGAPLPPQLRMWADQEELAHPAPRKSEEEEGDGAGMRGILKSRGGGGGGATAEARVRDALRSAKSAFASLMATGSPEPPAAPLLYDPSPECDVTLYMDSPKRVRFDLHEHGAQLPEGATPREPSWSETAMEAASPTVPEACSVETLLTTYQVLCRKNNLHPYPALIKQLEVDLAIFEGCHTAHRPRSKQGLH